MMWPEQIGSTFCAPATAHHLKAMNAMWGLENHPGYAAMKAEPSGMHPFTHFAQQLTAAQTGFQQCPSLPDTSPTSGSKRKKATPIPEESKDEAYRERRKRNNDSAKRSREQRRFAEEMNKKRLEGLMYENQHLRMQVCQLQSELQELRTTLMSMQAMQNQQMQQCAP